jgi:hypothetical protein
LSKDCAVHKKDIMVSGYLAFTEPSSPESKARLYLNRDDYVYYNPRQSILVYITKDIIIERERFHEKHVWVKGTFECDLYTHGMRTSGITKLTGIGLLEINPEATNQNALFPGSVIRRDTPSSELENMNMFFGSIQKKDYKAVLNYLDLQKDDIEYTVSRLSWILDHVPNPLVNSNQYKFCSSYRYEKEAQEPYVPVPGEIDDSGDEIATERRLYCYAKTDCSGFPVAGDEENYPDWRNSKDGFCLEASFYDNRILLNPIQFW